MGRGGASITQYFTFGGVDQVAVGTSEVSLPSNPARMVNVKADPANTGIVDVGKSGVTSGAGFQLGAGEETGYIPLDGNTNVVSVIADAVSQNVSIMWLE